MLSRYQGQINFSKVKEDGVNAVICRLGNRGSTLGGITLDGNFLSYYKQAKEAGLHIGCYFYSNAKNVAQVKEEAEFIYQTLSKYNISLDMPVYLDMEDASVEAVASSEIKNMAKAYLDYMNSKNIYAGIYANKYWATKYFDQSLFTSSTLWLAEWGSHCTYDGVYGMWQYTEKGIVNGISTPVDINICYVDFPALIKDRGFTMASNNITIYFGDANLDGKVTAADARLILLHASGIQLITTETLRHLDLNGDNRISAADARLALRVSSKLDPLIALAI